MRLVPSCMSGSHKVSALETSVVSSALVSCYGEVRNCYASMLPAKASGARRQVSHAPRTVKEGVAILPIQTSRMPNICSCRRLIRIRLWAALA